jgi:hypothetical protein
VPIVRFSLGALVKEGTCGTPTDAAMRSIKRTDCHDAATATRE